MNPCRQVGQLKYNLCAMPGRPLSLSHTFKLGFRRLSLLMSVMELTSNRPSSRPEKSWCNFFDSNATIAYKYGRPSRRELLGLLLCEVSWTSGKSILRDNVIRETFVREITMARNAKRSLVLTRLNLNEGAFYFRSSQFPARASAWWL